MNTLILLPLYNQPSFKEKLQLVISYIKFSMKNNSIGERESKIIVLTPLQEDLDIHFNIKQNVVIESVYVDEKNTRYICKKHKISNVL
ncbi:MAG: hypothetical protein RL208_576, partial [Pseudomonadota bacterium]